MLLLIFFFLCCVYILFYSPQLCVPLCVFIIFWSSFWMMCLVHCTCRICVVCICRAVIYLIRRTKLINILEPKTPHKEAKQNTGKYRRDREVRCIRMEEESYAIAWTQTRTRILSHAITVEKKICKTKTIKIMEKNRWFLSN